LKRRALIVDDEREARHRLARLLAAHKDEIEIASEAGDGPSAVGMIEEKRPDIVFLDVEMPGLDGFGVLDSLPQEQWPIIVFVTAYGHYATRAFDVHALDYLLKPVTAKRLAGCVSGNFAPGSFIARFGAMAMVIASSNQKFYSWPCGNE